MLGDARCIVGAHRYNGLMKYSMPCPAPGCQDVFVVDAATDEEAVMMFLEEKLPPRDQMPPMSDEQLKQLIRKRMQRQEP